jgi:transcriptional regulator with XRE-family HTH domain
LKRKELPVKKIQCTKCGQVFWTGLKQVDENLIASGEWIQHPCPRCGAEWAIVEPVRRPRATGRRRAEPAVRPRVRPRKAAPPAEEKAAVFSPARIRRLRRKLGISQKELAALTSVSLGAVGLWEKGKFKPKKDKMAQLASLLTKGKEDVKKLLAEKISSQPGKKAEKAQDGKPKGRRRAIQKAVALRK